MQSRFRDAAERLRADLNGEPITPARFVAALEQIPPPDRDAWLDALWDSDEIPLEDAALPRGCVPYLPCAVATVLAAVQQAAVTRDDVFVDVGSGAGRATLLAHLTTGARCVGFEIQPTLVTAARERAARLGLSRMQFVAGDAAELIRVITSGTVFLLYCPFGGERLQRFFDGLESIARTRPIRVCCVDMPPLSQSWLARLPSTSLDIDVYQSVLVTSRP